MKIKSAYLNSDLEVTSFEAKTSEGRDATIITHRSLEEAVLNQVPAEYGIRYDESIEHFSHNPLHIVVKCTMCDAKGRRVIAYGESNENTLLSDIARNNPALITEKRAFDRAAIRYLNIAGNVFSDQEGVTEPPVTASPKQTATSNAPAPVKKEEKAAPPKEKAEVAPESTAITPPAPGQPFTVLDIIDTVDEVDEAPTIETITNVPTDNQSEKEQVGSVMVNFGKFGKSPRTVADICGDEKESGWVQYVTADGFHSAKNADAVKAIKRYRELMGA